VAEWSATTPRPSRSIWRWASADGSSKVQNNSAENSLANAGEKLKLMEFGTVKTIPKPA
jgi:hypothetical protein